MLLSKAKIIAEGANGPYHPKLMRYFIKRRFCIAGRAYKCRRCYVSYFEWIQDLQSHFWQLEDMDKELKRIMTNSFKDVVKISEKEKCNMRLAAYSAVSKGLRMP